MVNLPRILIPLTTNALYPLIRAGIHQLPGRMPGEFLTKRESDEVVSLIEQWKDQPFFVQLSHYAVHTPIQALPGDRGQVFGYSGKSKQNAKIRCHGRVGSMIRCEIFASV